MAQAGRWGGGAIKYVFGMKSDHTEIRKFDDSGIAAGIADGFKLGATSGDTIVEQTQIAYDENGVPTFTYQQSDSSEDFFNFLDFAAPHKASGGGGGGATRNEKTAEDGRKIGGAGASTGGAQFLVIDYGSIGEDDKVLVTAAIGTFKRTSGGRTYTASDLVMPTLEFTGIAAKVDVVIGTGLFDPAMVTAIAQTLKKDYYSKEFFPAKPVATP
jgi:hypothetical protein